MDLSEIRFTENESKWFDILKRRSKDERITKTEIIALLRNGEPTPSEANGFLADVLSKDYTFKRGNTKWYTDNLAANPRYVASAVRMIEAAIKDPSKLLADLDEESRKEFEELHRRSKMRRSGNRIKPGAAAKQRVADAFGISVSHVRTLITEFNSKAKAQAKKEGCTIAEVKAQWLLWK